MHPLLAAGLANSLSRDRWSRPLAPHRQGREARRGGRARADARRHPARDHRRRPGPRSSRRAGRRPAAGALLADAADRACVLIAEVDGRLEAALALDDGLAVADPFRPSALNAELLALRARQLGGAAARESRSRPRAEPAHVVTSGGAAARPVEPAALQTVEWIARPTAFLRRCPARHGDPFTLRVAWADAPMVLVSDPAASGGLRRPVDVRSRRRELDLARAVRRPDLDPAHSRARAPAPAQAAARLPRRPLARARDDRRRWPRPRSRAGRAGEPLATHPRMQALTLDVILRVVLGPERPELRAAIRRALDMTASLPRLLVVSLHRARPRLPARGRRGRAAAHREIDRGGARRARLAARRPDAAGSGATSCATRSSPCSPPATRRRRARSRGRSSGSRTTRDVHAARCATASALPRRRRQGGAARAAGALDRRPPLAAPFELGGHVLPAGRARRAVHLPRPPPPGGLAGPDRVPPRALPGDGAPGQLPVPFGGGVRRCAGAAFAALELREVLRAVLARFALAPRRPGGERMRRGSVTLRPTRGGTRDRRAATTIEAVPLFCRHNRLTANCPICSREQAPSCARRRRRARRAPARASSRQAPRLHGPHARRRHAPRRARRRRRLPQPARPRPARDRRRRAARRRARAGPTRGSSRPARTRSSPRSPTRAGDLARVPARARRPGGARAAAGARAAPPALGRTACPRPPGRAPRTAQAYRAWAARAGSQEAAFTGDPGWTPERRFARVVRAARAARLRPRARASTC